MKALREFSNCGFDSFRQSFKREKQLMLPGIETHRESRLLAEKKKPSNLKPKLRERPVVLCRKFLCIHRSSLHRSIRAPVMDCAVSQIGLPKEDRNTI
jgi:hypothetical protein